MHGEGNPEADERYREGLERFASSQQSRRKAREAAETYEQSPSSGREGRMKPGKSGKRSGRSATLVLTGALGAVLPSALRRAG